MAIAVSNSDSRIWNMVRTPASPSIASPQKTGRPTITARAPSASALSTSVPRRTPESR